MTLEPKPNRERAKGRVLVVDDERVIAETLNEFLEGEGYQVAVAEDAETALAIVERFEPEVALCDIQLPGLDGLELLDRLLKIRPETLVVMITAYGSLENAVDAFRKGAHDYLLKPVVFDELSIKLGRWLGYRRLSVENQVLRRQLHESAATPRMVGRSEAMRAVKTLIAKLAPTRGNVLITGESGTGKELVARALHDQGPEPDAPFLAINCAAIPHDLLENQLFGHIRGAFTGADRDHDGVFVSAGRGTVFLDEIGELPLGVQAKLLRAIEAKEVLPVGASRPRGFSARILAATNKRLETEVEAGRFRADLYYRLNVVGIPLPPLRERAEDIPELVAALIERRRRSLGKRIDGVDDETMRLLAAAPWKGNVRELDNAIERAIILGDGPLLTLEDFPAELAALSPSRAAAENDPDDDDLRSALVRFERNHIRAVLDRSSGDKREAAKRLGLSLSSLYRKLEEP